MTNERLKEILQMVLEQGRYYLCNRITDLKNLKLIDEHEENFVINYMTDRRPDKNRIVFWWGIGPDSIIGEKTWIEQKHEWLQNLINEL